MNFNQLEIKSKRYEAAESVELTFDIPDEFREEYKFIPGQYITIAAKVNEQVERRAYSICSDSLEDRLSILVKKLPNGKVSTYVNDILQVGEKILVVPPNGSFSLRLDDLKHDDHIVLIGAGSGITPLISIIQSVLKSDTKVTCHLLYGSRTADSIIFKEKFDRLSLVYKEHLKIHHFISRPKISISGRNSDHIQYYSGKIDSTMINQVLEYIPKVQIQGFYMCGPGELIDNSLKDLKTIGFPETKLHREYFVAPDSGEELDIDFEELQERTVKVSLEGQEITTVINDSKDILRQLMADGYEPPYSCLQGTCSTCKAKLISGKVKMKVDVGLEADEKEEGYILTCQSIPITENVVCKY